MQLSNREKKKRKNKKELNSLRNKMGSNIVWFDSLSKTKQYDILFGWKKIKYKNTITKPEYRKVAKRVPIDPLRPWGRKKMVQVMELKYPASLKHFIKECRESNLFKPIVQNVRQTTIDIILNEK
jgi:hypothetical protein